MANRYSRTTELEFAAHVVTEDFDGLAQRDSEADGAKVLGVADLIPSEAWKRSGRWRIVVEFEALSN